MLAIMLKRLEPLLRGIAFALGLLAAVNLIASWRSPAFDPNIWWIDLRGLPDIIEEVLLAATSFVLVAWAIRPQMRRWRLRVAVLLLSTMAVQAIANAIIFYVLPAKGSITSVVPLPVSVLVALLLVLIMSAALSSEKPIASSSPAWRRAGLAAGFLMFLVLFPVAQMFLYGNTDYRRKADAILVFGARTYADGRPSQALADRVRTGCTLYHDGLAPVLIMSGGPGEGQIHETDAMAKLAVDSGVPLSAIICDRKGLNTEASIRQLQGIARDRDIHRVLAVSHYWHLPRIKLAVGRRDILVFTVPAVETRSLRQTPFLICREIAAFWKYYVELIAK